jgi:hypothetical protein
MARREVKKVLGQKLGLRAMLPSPFHLIVVYSTIDRRKHCEYLKYFSIPFDQRPINTPSVKSH